jgi:hypothetical protein
MAAHEILATIKLGRATKEFSLTDANGAAPLPGFAGESGSPRAYIENTDSMGSEVVQGARIKPTYRLRIPFANDTTKEILEGLRAVPHFLTFVFANEWLLPAQEYITDSLTTLTLIKNSFVQADIAYNTAGGAALLKNFQAWDTYSVDGTGGGGVDYYAAGGGGSYARATGIITLGASPGAIGTTLYVNYTYDAALVRIVGKIRWRLGDHIATNGRMGWDLEVRLAGV